MGSTVWVKRVQDRDVSLWLQLTQEVSADVQLHCG